MRTQTLSADELNETIQTKGVFKGVKANVGGVDFHFGTGGIHGSVAAQRITEDAEWAIVDIDVAQLYPQLAIQNNLAPEHLGQRFTEEYGATAERAQSMAEKERQKERRSQLNEAGQQRHLWQQQQQAFRVL
jgi:hypothetical protein